MSSWTVNCFDVYAVRKKCLASNFFFWDLRNNMGPVATGKKVRYSVDEYPKAAASVYNLVSVWTHRERQRERHATKLSLVARVVAWKFGCTHRLRACVRQIGMASYILEYDIIHIGMWHIYWNVASHKLEYAVIFIVICCHIYWNMLSYLLEYIIIFSGIYYFIICHHIYLLLYSKSDKNYIQTITSVKFLGGIPPNNSKNIDI